MRRRRVSRSLVRMSATSPWRLEANQANLAGGPFNLLLDLNHPEHGATLRRDSPISQSLWAWAHGGLRANLVESYLRGRDLVARYEPVDGAPFHTQVYWRCETPSSESDSLRLSLILSIHTDQLDTHPTYTVESAMSDCNASEIQTDATASLSPGTLFTADDQSWSMVETSQPGEAISCSGSKATAAAASRWRLFDQFLEKGVIRRARLSLVVAQGVIDASRAASLCRELQAAPAPLTA